MWVEILKQRMLKNKAYCRRGGMPNLGRRVNVYVEALFLLQIFGG
jgi:hypothetical protein